MALTHSVNLCGLFPDQTKFNSVWSSSHVVNTSTIDDLFRYTGQWFMVVQCCPGCPTCVESQDSNALNSFKSFTNIFVYLLTENNPLGCLMRQAPLAIGLRSHDHAKPTGSFAGHLWCTVPPYNIDMCAQVL